MSSATNIMHYRGKKYPFYRTNRAVMNWQNAGYTEKQIADGNIEAMLAMSYHIVIDCARRADIPFTDDFDTFIDNSDNTTLDKQGEVQETPMQEQDKPDSLASTSKSE